LSRRTRTHIHTRAPTNPGIKLQWRLHSLTLHIHAQTRLRCNLGNGCRAVHRHYTARPCPRSKEREDASAAAHVQDALPGNEGGVAFYGSAVRVGAWLQRRDVYARQSTLGLEPTGSCSSLVAVVLRHLPEWQLYLTHNDQLPAVAGSMHAYRWSSRCAEEQEQLAGLLLSTHKP